MNESVNRTRFIAVTGDSDFIYPLGVAINSLATHERSRLHVDYALPTDWPTMVTEADLHMVKSLVQSLDWTMDFVECPIEASNLPRTRHISSMTFMKPAYLDVSIRNQVAFLDGDLIAVGRWSELLNPLPANVAIAAARETNMHDFELKWMPSRSEHWYINAGVLVASPSIWQRDYSTRWRTLLDEFDEHGFVYLEQDVMNATLLGNAGHLPESLNSRPAYDHDPNSAAIVHYAGWWKPWLTVKEELRGLTPFLHESYSMYQTAETRLINHVTSALGPQASARWAQAKRHLRGRLSWRAHRRYIRWRLAQQIRSGQSLG